MDFLEQLSAPQHLQAFMTSLAIGLLIGLERERRSSSKAGLRTFALVALLGTLSGLLAEKADSGWILAGGLLAVGAMIIAVGANDPVSSLLSFVAVAFATLNVVGGYVVTDRMLQMFRRKPATPKAEKAEKVED